MVELSSEMAGLWAALGAPGVGPARVIQVTAARTGEGASTVARELACHAAHKAGRSVWLVDLDLATASQYQTIHAGASRFGELSEPMQASPDGSTFFAVQPAERPGGGTWPDERYLAAYRIGSARWWVTRFLRERLAGPQSVHIRPTADYWSAMRRFAEVIIVDCPSPESSRAAFALAPFMDQTVLVVAADQPDVDAPARFADALASAGGQMAGVFLNRAP